MPCPTESLSELERRAWIYSLESDIMRARRAARDLRLAVGEAYPELARRLDALESAAMDTLAAHVELMEALLP